METFEFRNPETYEMIKTYDFEDMLNYLLDRCPNFRGKLWYNYCYIRGNYSRCHEQELDINNQFVNHHQMSMFYEFTVLD